MTKKTFLLGFTALWCGLSMLSAQVTIGKDIAPQTTLDIIGDTANVHGKAFRLIDGNQLNSRVLTSDNNGVGTWKQIITPVIFGDFSTATGVNLCKDSLISPTSNFFVGDMFRNTGAYIDLPNGVWRIDITLFGSYDNTYRTDSTTIWVRLTLADVAPYQNMSADVGLTTGGAAYRLVSGQLDSKLSLGRIISGSMIVRNSTPNTKRYYLVAGHLGFGRIAASVPTKAKFVNTLGSSTHSENSLTALPINLP
jgi:hypothetical protein